MEADPFIRALLIDAETTAASATEKGWWTKDVLDLERNVAHLKSILKISPYE